MRKNFRNVGFYPQPVLVVGTYDQDGIPDAMNVGWGGLVGGTYVELNISRGHKTTENIRQKRAFTLSFADQANLVAADYVGLVSGYDVPDKIARAGLTPVAAKKVDAPIYREAELAVECTRLCRGKLDGRNFFLKSLVEEHYPDRDYHSFYIGRIEAVTGIGKYVKE